MQIIKIQDILPNLKKVQLVSELLLIDSLNTVGEVYYNVRIDARGLKILKNVMATHAFAHIMEKVESGKGALMDVVTVPEYKVLKNAEFLDTPLKLYFDMEKELGTWIFVRSVLYDENSKVSRGFYSQGYLQVIAHYMLYNYINKTNIKLRIVQEHILGGYKLSDGVPMYSDFEYCHLLLLQRRGSKILDVDNFELLWEDMPGTSQEWSAYCINYCMHGLFGEKYSAKVKYNYFKSQFAVGDVILVYSRISRVKKNNAQSYRYINACYPAVVVEVTNTSITYIKYMCVKTRLTAYYQYQRMLEQGGVGIYTADEIYAFPSSPCKRSWEAIGVEGYSYNESEIIVTPMEDDETQQWLTKDDVYPTCLNTLETIYAVFEDRNVPYNKERFLEKYFKGKTPIYDQKVRGIK